MKIVECIAVSNASQASGSKLAGSWGQELLHLAAAPGLQGSRSQDGFQWIPGVLRSLLYQVKTRLCHSEIQGYSPIGNILFVFGNGCMFEHTGRICADL